MCRGLLTASFGDRVGEDNVQMIDMCKYL
jgi:hypothetical protein